jgi:hypothetical protein
MATSEAEARWARLVREQEGSGMSIREFARSRDLSSGTLGWWRSELRRRRAGRGVVRLAEVTVVGGEPPRAPSSGRIEVQLSNGRRLLLAPGFDVDAVRALVEALERC